LGYADLSAIEPEAIVLILRPTAFAAQKHCDQRAHRRRVPDGINLEKNRG
jgi:hypothetical protein